MIRAQFRLQVETCNRRSFGDRSSRDRMLLEDSRYQKDGLSGDPLHQRSLGVVESLRRRL